LIKIVISIDFSTALGEIDVILDNETFDRFGYHYADAKSLDQIVCSCDFCGAILDPRLKRDIEQARKRNKDGLCRCSANRCQSRLLISRGKKSVASYRHLVKQWHPTKNGDLKPEDVIAGSGDNVWWLDDVCGYEWQASPHARTRKQGTGCPACNGDAATPANCLSVTHPKIAAEVFPTKAFPLTAHDVMAGSGKLLNFKCKELGHEFQSRPQDRTRKNGTGCPDCYNIKRSTGKLNRRETYTNSLLYRFPEIAKELSPNNKKKAHEISYGSTKKQLFVCPAGHGEYLASVNNRTNQNQGCPICAQNVPYENSLEFKLPEIAKELSPNNKKKAHEISYGSKEKQLFICFAGHKDYLATPVHRARGCGCPECYTIRRNTVDYKDSLASMFPEVAKELSPNNKKKAHEISHGSNKKQLFICPVGHGEYLASVNNRTGKRKSCCPKCNYSKLEKLTEEIIENYKIDFDYQWKDDFCKNILKLPFDFAIIVNGNMVALIECQGVQHFEISNFGSKKINGYENLKKIQANDKIKRDFCNDYNIPLLEIHYKWNPDKIEKEIKKFLINLGLI
jgi:hypothetical protein